MPHSECSGLFAACGGALLIILINKPSERLIICPSTSWGGGRRVMIVGCVLKTSWFVYVCK